MTGVTAGAITLVRSLGGRHLGWVLSTARMLFHDPTRSYLHILDLNIKRLCKGSTDVNTLRSHQISRVWFNTFHKHWFALVQAIASQNWFNWRIPVWMKSTCSATGSEIPDNANLDDAWAGHPDTSRRSQGCKGMTRQGGLQMLQNYIYILYSYYIYICYLYINVSWLLWPTNARPVSVTAFGWSRPAKSVFLRFR